eukprot:scaffold272518_cov30-Tisochrysis_lutea.AAC.6
MSQAAAFVAAGRARNMRTKCSCSCFPSFLEVHSSAKRQASRVKQCSPASSSKRAKDGIPCDISRVARSKDALSTKWVHVDARASALCEPHSQFVLTRCNRPRRRTDRHGRGASASNAPHPKPRALQVCVIARPQRAG